MNTAVTVHFPVDGILEVFSSFTEHQQSALHSAALFPHQKLSDISKTGMGVIKTVKECWRRQEMKVVTRRSSSSGNQQAYRPPPEPRILESGVTKPRNRHRIVVLGAHKVGKTNLIRRFLGGEYEEQYETTIEDFYRKLFYIEGEAYQIDLLDAARERDFPAKRRLSILTGDIFLLVFSLDDKESLNEVRALLTEIRATKAKIQKPTQPLKAPVVVCGNKADLDAQRVVSGLEAGEVLGEDVPFFETSAKTGTGLEAVFTALATLGGLPDETRPSRHEIVPILTYQSLCVGERGRGRRRHSRGIGAPCAAVDPLARRPSFTSDLRMVLGSSTKHKKPETCQVQ
uniref:Uncharacterized protein n=1 Tax=Nothobranchius kadleci TaxID=1051664 RepID=A0A1A8BM69_NOTKA